MTQNRNRTAASLPRRIEPAATAPQLAAEPDDFNLYYSSAVAGDLGALLGAPHYSYRFAESKFLATFTAERATVHPLPMPEYYNSPAALPAELHAEGKTDVHLIFRSAEQIRLLKFAWNVCCFAWEFDVIKDHTGIDEHPFLNQKRMLSLCQEIWVPCSYTKAVLESHGLRNAQLIPAPIPPAAEDPPPLLEALSSLGHLSVAPLHYNFLRSQAENRAACAERSSTFLEYMGARLKACDELRIYLTVLNPEDFRKNLDAMLRAFDLFSRTRRDAVLVVKVLTAASRFHLLDVLCDVIPNKMASGTVLRSDNIVFFNDFLSERELSYLYSIADFYLCTSLCEGQNLPLLEAMAHGVVPVSTANTAMADYIHAENAIVIRGRLEPNDCVHLAGTLAGRPFSVHRSGVADIHDALERSVALSPVRYATLAAGARHVTRVQYSPQVIWSAIAARLAAIRSLTAGKVAAQAAPWH
jgi:glycosyltransferase involved in cell wall biosynthesis